MHKKPLFLESAELRSLLGEVLLAPDDNGYGTSMNLAARPKEVAKAGQIVLSDEVRARLTHAAEGIASNGEKTLKNIPNAVNC